MTITREQLELAAKAAGLEIGFWSDSVNSFAINQYPAWWNPLTDHGQLLDLAMACGMFIDFRYGTLEVETATDNTILYHFTPDNFTSLAEAVITAAAEQQQAKETME